MSERAIQTGDLVMVVRACCPHHAALGRIETVIRISPGPSVHDGRYGRSSCGRKDYGAQAVFLESPLWFVPLAWLKRIDPLTEPESVPHGDRVEA